MRGAHTLCQLLDLVEKDYRNNKRKDLDNLLCLSRHIRKFFGTSKATAITSEDIERYKTYRLEQGKAPATINRGLAVIRRAYTLALRHRLLQEAPYIEKFKEDNVRRGFLDPGAFDRLVQRLHPDFADFCRFGYLTGWRKGEISLLKWSRVFLDSDSMYICLDTSKNGSSRILPLRGELLKLIKHRKSLEKAHLPWVFHYRGRRIRRFPKSWRRALQEAKLGGHIRFHDMRRSAVRNMRKAGVPESVAMTITGHKTRSVFLRYDIVDENDVEQALLDTERFISKQTE